MLDVSIREVTEDDLPIFFEHQLDPDATAMAAFPSRDHDAFMAHWKKIMADETCVQMAIVFDGAVAGNIGSWEQDGERLIGYWIGKTYWGKGIATAALNRFVEIEQTRPLYAHVVKHNVGSIRVLEKCGFTLVDEHVGDDGITEAIMILAA